MTFLFLTLLTPLQSILNWLRWEGGAFCQKVRAWAGFVGWADWLQEQEHFHKDLWHSPSQGLLKCLTVEMSKKRKHHEEASRHCAGAFVCLGLLWAGATPEGHLKDWAAAVLLREGEELTSPADFLSSSSMGSAEKQGTGWGSGNTFRVL